MTTAYLIFNKGLDYNDETYSIGGEGAEVKKKGYATIDEAREALKDTYKEFFGGKYPMDIRDWTWESDEYPEATSWDEDRESTWIEFINHREEHGLPWLYHVPQLFEVVEVQIPD